MDEAGSDPDQVFLELALPPVPELPVSLVEAWLAAHEDRAAAGGLPDPARRIFDRWVRARGIEGLAGITPSVSGSIDAPLFPAGRAFLSDHDRARVAGTRAALDHVDVRLRLADEGIDPSLVRGETLYVLNALAEGPRADGVITNPGQLRGKPSRWALRSNPYEMPPPAVLRHLVVGLADALSAPPPPPVVTAGWAAFSLMSIHPFVDGNGRTARLLFVLLASAPLPHLDLGAVTFAGLHRREYIDALQAGQWTTPHWDPRRLDAGPFTRTMAGWSIEAAHLDARRAEVAAAVLEAVAPLVPDRDPEGLLAALVLGVWLERIASVSTFSDVAEGDLERGELGRHEASVALEVLVQAGILCRAAMPPSRRFVGRAETAYSLAEAPAQAAWGAVATLGG